MRTKYPSKDQITGTRKRISLISAKEETSEIKNKNKQSSDRESLDTLSNVRARIVIVE